MKILHTADWHLNERLYGRDLTPNLRQRVEEIAAICDREKVDVLVIAGDLFSEQARVNAFANEVADSFRHLRSVFGGFFARGGIILAITGNHDQDNQTRYWLDLTRAGMDLAEPPRAQGERFTRGKMYLLDSAYVGRIHSKTDDFDVQFVLLPYPNRARVLTGGEGFQTPEQQNRLTHEQVAQWIRDLPTSPGYDPRLRTVFVGHLNVDGADLGRGLAGGWEQTALTLDAAALPTGFDYVALGHIHKPQPLKGLAHVRYSGSLDRFAADEHDQVKSVVVVEIGPQGRRGEPAIHALQSTSLAKIVITDAANAREEFAAQMASAQADIVTVEIAPTASAAASAIERIARELVPEVARIDRLRPELEEAPGVVAESGSVRERVLGYLETAVAPDDPDREPLAALAVKLLDHQGHR